MIRIVTTLLLILLSYFTEAQTKFEKGMEQAFALQQEQKLEESANLLERIASAETDNWLPSYHLALLQTRMSFGTKDKEKRSKQIAAAEEHIATADMISPDNSEILVVKALINVAKVASDPMTYGPTLSAPTTELYKKAIALDASNPRAHSGLAEFEMGGARFFGQDLAPYCKRLQESIALYDAFKPKGKFYPNWGKKWTLQVIESCRTDKKTDEAPITVTATVENVLSTDGDIKFALYTKDGFLNKPIMSDVGTIKDGKATVTFKNVPKGEYAIVCYHDKNANDKMDFEPNGMPKEDFGTSNNVMRMGPPLFEDAKFKVENKSVDLKIRF